jgi:Xaa-Pro aminopeptidase
MSEAVVIYADGQRSMDLFQAVPAAIIDPYLYFEVAGRRVALISHIDHETLRAVDSSIEVLDPLSFGRRELLNSGMSRVAVEIEVARRGLQDAGVTRAVVGWDFPVALADALRAGGIEVREDHRAFERRRRVKTALQLDGIRRAQHAADVAMGVAARMVHEWQEGLTAEAVRSAMRDACEARDCELPEDVIVAVGSQGANGHDPGSGPIGPEPGSAGAGAGGVLAARQDGARPRDGRDPARDRRSRPARHRVFRVRGGRASDPALDARRRDTGPRLPARARPRRRSGRPRAARARPLGRRAGRRRRDRGCYRQGFGGVRLEDLLLVTPAGCEVLTDFPYAL